MQLKLDFRLLRELITLQELLRTQWLHDKEDIFFYILGKLYSCNALKYFGYKDEKMDPIQQILETSKSY